MAVVHSMRYCVIENGDEIVAEKVRQDCCACGKIRPQFGGLGARLAAKAGADTAHEQARADRQQAQKQKEA